MAIVVERATAERWDDLVELFERPGPRGGLPIPGSCWCMAWRDNQPSRTVRKQAMHDLVTSERTPGLIAYVDGTPMGWVSVGPRHDYARLQRSRLYGPQEEDDAARVFAIVCFYVDPVARGEGVSGALLDAAIDDATARGATAIDAFPNAQVAPHAAAGGRAEENFSFMGRLGSYERRGFAAVREPGAARVVMRLEL